MGGKGLIFEQNRYFSHDVKNNRLSLLLELNFILTQIFCIILYTNMATLSREWKPSIRYFLIVVCSFFKASLGAQSFKWKLVFHFVTNQTHFHVSGSEPRLAAYMALLTAVITRRPCIFFAFAFQMHDFHFILYFEIWNYTFPFSKSW